MGNCAGGPQTAEEREAKARSEQIDKGLKKDKDIIENTIKILLLGAGESGKSTVVKQMKIIHGDGYQREELESYKSTIHDNLLTSMRTVINGMNMLSIALTSKGNEQYAEAVVKYPTPIPTGGSLPEELVEAIKTLWGDAGVQEAFRRAYEYLSLIHI